MIRQTMRWLALTRPALWLGYRASRFYGWQLDELDIFGERASAAEARSQRESGQTS